MFRTAGICSAVGDSGGDHLLCRALFTVLFVCFLNLFRAEAVVFLCRHWPHTGKCGGGEHAIGSRALQRGFTPGGGN